ncbi:hypothetical protein LSH36_253g04094, partial [Paralvinella palmiformis]
IQLLVWCKDVQGYLPNEITVTPTTNSLNVTWTTMENYTICIGEKTVNCNNSRASSYCVATDLKAGAAYLIKVLQDSDNTSYEETRYTSKSFSLSLSLSMEGC